MAIHVWPVDAVEGAPEYSGRVLRQTMSAYISGAVEGRPLGASSGVRPGTPADTVEADSTTWTVHPHGGILDLQAADEAGPYAYAVADDETGAVDAAHATMARVDIITVRIDDPAEGDGSTVPGVLLGYKAGTPASTPAAPTPDTSRELVIAHLNVPASGGGTPTVTWVAPIAGIESDTFAAAASHRALSGYDLPIVSIDGNWVRLDATRIQRAASSATWTAGTVYVLTGAMPEKYRPAVAQTIMSTAHYGAADAFAVEVTVNTDGTIQARPLTTGTMNNGAAHWVAIPSMTWPRQAA